MSLTYLVKVINSTGTLRILFNMNMTFTQTWVRSNDLSTWLSMEHWNISFVIDHQLVELYLSPFTIDIRQQLYKVWAVLGQVISSTFSFPFQYLSYDRAKAGTTVIVFGMTHEGRSEEIVLGLRLNGVKFS